MKELKLKKGEPAYVSVPEGCLLSVQYTNIIQNGRKLILIRVI